MVDASQLVSDLLGDGQNASETAIKRIREAIVLGRFSPGQRLKETDLASALGLSRTPVREALRVLSAEGLVESSPKRGAVVRSYAAVDLHEIYQMRGLLEGYSAQLAAERATPADLALLRESCKRFEQLEAGRDLIELVKENIHFHSLVHAAARSARLANFVRQVIDVPLVYRSYSWYSEEQKMVAQSQHEQIVVALESGDPERAELAMRIHVLEQRDFLIRHLEQDGQEAISGAFPTG